MVGAQAYLLERTGGQGVTDALDLLLQNLINSIDDLGAVASAAGDDEAVAAGKDATGTGAGAGAGTGGDGDGGAKDEEEEDRLMHSAQRHLSISAPRSAGVGDDDATGEAASSSTAAALAFIHASPAYHATHSILKVGWGGFVGRVVQCAALPHVALGRGGGGGGGQRQHPCSFHVLMPTCLRVCLCVAFLLDAVFSSLRATGSGQPVQAQLQFHGATQRSVVVLCVGLPCTPPTRCESRGAEDHLCCRGCSHHNTRGYRT